MERNAMGEKSAKYFFDHYDELTEKYGHKFLVIYNCEIMGVYDTEDEALRKASEQYILGTFAIQETGMTHTPRLFNVIGGDQ